MKKSKPTKSNEQYKILRMIARDEQFERNGGGQFVAMNRAFRNKSKYNRKDKKKELRKDGTGKRGWNERYTDTNA